jgi:predicted glycosyltransferase
MAKKTDPVFPMTLTFATEAEMIAFIRSKVLVSVGWGADGYGLIEAKAWVPSSTGGEVLDSDIMYV